MKENTPSSVDYQPEHSGCVGDLLLETVGDGDRPLPLVKNKCYEEYNVSYGKNNRSEENANYAQIVNQLSIILDKNKNKKSKTDKTSVVPIKLEQSNNLCEPGALKGLSIPTDPDKLLFISKQDMMNPNGVILHSGMKLEEFIRMLVNTLRAGDESQVTFLGREMYLLKNLKPPISQSEVEMHNLALNKIKNAILYYITNYVDEKHAIRVFYALYLMSHFFVTRSNTEDAECIIKALLLIRKCPTKNIDMDIEKAFFKKGKKKCRVTESEILSALEEGDVKLIRCLVFKFCSRLHDEGDFTVINVVSESFPEPHRSMENTDVYDSGAVKENFNFANNLWKELINLALETDKKIKYSKDNPFVGLGVNVIGVAMDALRKFYNGTFYTSNTTSKLSILSSACVFLSYARSQLAASYPPVFFLESDIRNTVDALSDKTFDYERDHCYVPTSERYETTGLIALDEVYAPRSSAVTYVPHQEFPSLVEKISGTCPKQIQYYKYLTEQVGDDTMKKPCTPATALYATALKLASTNYTEMINDQYFMPTLANFIEEDRASLISKVCYNNSTDEHMMKKFRTTTVNDKYGLDKSFMYAVKRLLGVSTPPGKYGLNLVDAIWPSDVKQDEMNGPSKRHKIAFESGIIEPHNVIEYSNLLSVNDLTAEDNWDDFIEYLSTTENKMRFLSLIILRAIMGVGKKLERSDIHLCFGEDRQVFYVTIDNEERVGIKKCEDVLEDSSEFIALCTPITNEDIHYLPPWCVGLFDGDCNNITIEKPKNERAAATPAVSDDDDFIEAEYKKPFKYSDLTRYFHEMSLEQLEKNKSHDAVVKKMIHRNMKAARNAEHDKTLADVNSRLRSAYGAAIQDKYLYDESSRGDVYSQEYDSDQDIYNPFIPEGEKAFCYPQDTEHAQIDDPTLQECVDKSEDKVSLPSSDDECQRGNQILISRKMILNDIKMSITEAARTSSFVFFDKCMRRIFRNLNRIVQATELLFSK